MTGLKPAYCPQCASIAPEYHYDKAYCIPCLNTGHIYRLVKSEEDRLWCIDLWTKHWTSFNVPLDSVDSPVWINLHNPPKECHTQ